MGAELFHEDIRKDGRKDGHRDISKLIVAFLQLTFFCESGIEGTTKMGLASDFIQFTSCLGQTFRFGSFTIDVHIWSNGWADKYNHFNNLFSKKSGKITQVVESE